MTLKHRFTYTFIKISFFLLLFTGCRKEEFDLNYSNAQVEVVLSPGGVGDQGYNDKILRGFQLAAASYLAGATSVLDNGGEGQKALELYPKPAEMVEHMPTRISQ